MAAAPRAAQWFTAADGTRHPLIEISSDSSDNEVAAGGSCDALAPLDPSAAQAGDASEDDECDEERVRADLWHCMWIYWQAHQRSVCVTTGAAARAFVLAPPRIALVAGVRMYSCSACLYQSEWKSHFDAHARTHTG